MIGKKALQTGVNVAQDVLDGDNIKRQSANRLNKPLVYLPRIHCRDNQELVKKLSKGKRKEPKSVHLSARKQKHLRSKRSVKPFLTKNRMPFVHHESRECT